ncbi:Amino acid transporter-like protein [Zostera marina]|uniref:Amino acid transporter-like protein n=1 Tax=Zostera marina TaxID=29655 RepID=A0A0K9PPD6_ZOSMR|nr:Amino acid transporter-like protein [Zostera marina]
MENQNPNDQQSMMVQQFPNNTSPRASEHDGLPLVNNSDSNDSISSGSDVSGAVFNLSTTIIGAGIMALPATMRVLGLLIGFIAIVVMGFVSEISVELLVRFSVLTKSKSYGEVVHSALGDTARIISEICIIINNAGVLVVYLIIIGDVMSGNDAHVGIFFQWFGHTVLDNRALVIFIILVFFLAPLCSFQRIESLETTSAAAVALAILFVFISCLITFIKIINGTVRTPRMGPDFTSAQTFTDLLVVIPIMSNAYVCHFNIQPIYNDLRDRSIEKMNRVGRITTVLCVVIFALTALSGYLLFGDNTEADVLTNFDRDLGIRFSTALNYIIRIGYILHLMPVFAIIHFSLRQAVGALIFKESILQGRKKVWGITAVQLIILYIGAAAIPNIWVAFKFTGATTALALGFIFPSLIVLRLGTKGTTLTNTERIIAWCMLVLAVIISILGLVGSVYSLRA